jgi:hypothetical protein
MQTLNRILIVLVITILVALAMAPLAQTSWADGMRTTTSDRPQEGRPEGPGGLPSGVGFFVGLLRPTLFLLIPGSIALGVLNAIRRPNKQAPANISVKPTDR